MKFPNKYFTNDNNLLQKPSFFNISRFFQRISAHSKKYKLFSYPPATDYFVFANFAGTQTSRQAAFILQFRGTWFCTSVTKPSLSTKHL